MRWDKTEPNLALRDAAIDWVVRCQADPQDAAGFDLWRSRSPAHEAAAREAEAVWRDVGLTRTAARFAAVPPPAHHPAYARRAMLAGAALAGAAGIVALSGGAPIPAAWRADHVTRLGERRRVTLPDSSVALLNTATALSVHYAPGERRVVLHAGEALFEVDPGDERPFSVTAATGQVRSRTGTFDVRCEDDRVQVLALEGEVVVCPDLAPRLPLPAGQRLTYSDGRVIKGAAAVDINAEMAWQRGKLIFNRRPLSEVVAELERYRRGRIVIADASLRSLVVTGVFDLPDTDSVLASVEQTLSLRATRLPLVTVLRR